MHARRASAASYPRGSFSFLLRVLRRHVDLQRVNSALCPGIAPAR
ncbi:putative leader peptide [Actinacidiphila acididurans]|nr:putative leader peptide [Actinacidiphila acididurans]